MPVRQLRLQRPARPALIHTAAGVHALTAASAGLGATAVIVPDPELTPRQNLIFLLQTAAEVEHTLLIEYLYAAYSLNPQAKDSAGNPLQTRTWQLKILSIAREEMGHLLTVQNVLRFLGGPLHFDREHFPYRSQLYPFPFALQRLTKKSDRPGVWGGVKS